MLIAAKIILCITGFVGTGAGVEWSTHEHHINGWIDILLLASLVCMLLAAFI